MTFIALTRWIQAYEMDQPVYIGISQAELSVIAESEFPSKIHSGVGFRFCLPEYALHFTVQSVPLDAYLYADLHYWFERCKAVRERSRYLPKQ